MHSDLADILPAFFMGITDTVNPNELTALLSFIIFLAWLPPCNFYYRMGGGFFVIAFILMSSFINIGFFDAVLLKPHIINAIHLMYCLVAVAFIVFGILHYRDWIRIKEEGRPDQFKLKLLFLTPVLPAVDQIWERTLTVVLVGSILGIFLSWLNTFWPQSAQLTGLYYIFFSGGKVKLAVWTQILYSIAIACPFIIVLIGHIWVLNSKRIRNALLPYISTVKMIYAAIYLSSGIGLSYLYIWGEL